MSDLEQAQCWIEDACKRLSMAMGLKVNVIDNNELQTMIIALKIMIETFNVKFKRDGAQEKLDKCIQSMRRHIFNLKMEQLQKDLRDKLESLVGMGVDPSGVMIAFDEDALLDSLQDEEEDDDED